MGFGTSWSAIAFAENSAPTKTKNGPRKLRAVLILFLRFELGELDLAVIVTVTVMVVVKVTVYDVAGVIAMRNGFMSASCAMSMTCVVSTASVTGTATIKGMLVYMIAMLMMKVTIMQVIYMITVLNSSVSAGI